MAAIVLSAVGILSLLVFVLFSVLVEVFRDVRQIRDALGILDRPLTIDIGLAAGTPPSSYGLSRQLDDEPFALLLFLSDRCATCRVLAASLGGRTNAPRALGAGIDLPRRAGQVVGQVERDHVRARGIPEPSPMEARELAIVDEDHRERDRAPSAVSQRGAGGAAHAGVVEPAAQAFPMHGHAGGRRARRSTRVYARTPGRQDPEAR